MRYFLILFFSLILVVTISAQSYFSNIYDPFDHASEEINQLGIKGDEILLYGRGNCEKFTQECHVFVRVNLDGNQQFAKAYTSFEFESGTTAVTQDSHYFIGGGNEPVNSKFILFKFSYNGDSLGYTEFNFKDSSYTYYFDRSIVELNDQVVMYGQVVDTVNRNPNGKEQTDGLIVWVNKDNMEVNDFTIIKPPFEWMIFDDFKTDRLGDLTIIYEYIDSVENFTIKPRFKTITKIDENHDTLFHWVSPFFYSNFGRLHLTFLNNENLVFNFTDSFESSHKIWCVNPQGETVWEYEFDHNFEKKVFVYDLETTAAGDIIGCGMQESGGLAYGLSGFIFKLSPQGELLWERIFLVDVDQHPLNPAGWPKFSWLNDIIELPNGDLAAGGRIYNFYDDPVLGPRDDIDMWLVKTDSEGCINEDCGVEQIITKTKERFVKETIDVFPNPTMGLINFTNPDYDTYEVFNFNGKLLKSGNKTFEIDISAFPQGIYLLKIWKDQQLHTHKIIKI